MGCADSQCSLDVLTRLSDAQTKTWAMLEERGLKLAWQIAARLDAARSGLNGTLAPWFDAYYVRSDRAATQSAPRD